MALTGDRFRESDVPAIPTLGRRRSARAPPAEPFMGGMARRPDGTPSEDRDHLRGRPTLFSGRAKSSLFTVNVKPTLTRHFQKRLSVKQSYGLWTVADTYRCRALVCGVERSPYSIECGTQGGPSPDPRFRTSRTQHVGHGGSGTTGASPGVECW